MAERVNSRSEAQIIAIDGPAGAGKSTVAKKVAERLGFSYLDTGAMYRVVTLKALEEKADFANVESIRSCARTSRIRFEERPGSPMPAVFLNDRDVTEAIRTPEISRNVSDVAKDAVVRDCMTRLQREIGARGHWVVDGRDIGTVVFPNATVKIFLTASIEERALRRMKELQGKGFPADLETLKKEIARRDEIDSNRETAPLKQADGAVLVDTTSLDINQVVGKIIEIVTQKGKTTRTEGRMEDVKQAAKGKKQEETMETMEQMLKAEESGEFHTVRSGAIVTGTILDVTPSEIYVDINYKTDGVIEADQVPEEIRANLKKGDKLRVYVKHIDDNRGQVKLSLSRARELDAWNQIEEAFRKKTLIEGVIKGRTKGGFEVDIQGVRAFLPQSQLSHAKNLKENMGKPCPMMVMEFDRRRKNVVVSERALAEEARNKRRDEVFAQCKVGDMIKGVVSRIVEYGAFVDLGGGLEGLIHRNDISWSVIGNPREVLQPGQEIEAKILKMDTEKGKIGLGLKQKKEDPWGTVDQRYEVGRRYEGRVKNIMDFGAFVELEEGVEGLVHISDLSWARNVRHPSDIVKSGDQITVVVKEIDKTKKRISLSYKETQPHPWDDLEKKIKIGDVVKGKVNNLTDFGAFIDIGEGIEGLLHISDMDWVKKINHPKEVLEKGQEVEVKILNIDSKGRRLSLGLKQTQNDPWENVETTYHVGETVSGVVKNLVSYGAFIQLESGLEGLLHVSEVSWEKEIKDISEVLKVGDQVQVTVYEVDKSRQKIGLSLKRLSDDPWKGIEKRFPVNSIQPCKVKTIDNNGVEVELAENIFGYIHISQIDAERVQHPSEKLSVGQEIFVKVLELDRKNRRMKLSRKEAMLDSEQQELRRFQVQSNQGFSDSIGDLMRDKLEAIKEQLKG